jgi:diguanylate cyclase (GGDEF)-like protein
MSTGNLFEAGASDLERGEKTDVGLGTSSSETSAYANRPRDAMQGAIVESASPFSREHIAARVLPFGLLTLLAAASIGLPPGPKSIPEAAVAEALLAGVAASFLLPWERIPRSFGVLVPLVYTAAAILLDLCEGTTVTGIGIVLLVPVVWTALYHRPWESAVVVVASGVAQIVTSLIPVALPAAVTARKVAFWVLLATLISMGVQSLRAQVRRNAENREARLRQTRALVFAAEELTATLDPDEVVTKATSLAAHLVTPSGTAGRRAQYMRISRGVVRLVAEYDETGEHVSATFPLAEHPNLERVVRSRAALSVPVDPATLGATVREIIERLGITNSVYVPIVVGEDLDGVLSVSVRELTVPPELFEQCKALGHVVELALSNARAHTELRKKAVTDTLTGLLNRRGFDDFIDNRPGRSGFAIIVLDLDGLKRINDTRGHPAGDALLVRVGAVVSRVLRRGDVIARIGGDEFAAFIFDANEQQARRVGERILSALQEADADGALSVSIGIAVGNADDDARQVHDNADAAMYRAKRGGGRRYAFDMKPVG